VSTDKIPANNWRKVEISWDPTKGLELYVDKVRVAGTTDSRTHAPLRVTDYNLYLGRPNDDNSQTGMYANAVIDELEYWFANRYILTAAGLIDDSGRIVLNIYIKLTSPY